MNHRATKRRRAPLAVLLLLAHTACYSYHTLEPQPGGTATATAMSTTATSATPSMAEQLGLVGLKQGTGLRIFLTEPGSYPLNHVTPNTVMQIDGDLINSDDENVRVSATWMKTAGVQEFKGNGETVTVPLDKIETVQQKKISAGKTAAMSAAIAGAVVLLGVTLGTGGGGEGGGGPPPNPD
jgi:hypothetical protein